MRIDKDWSDVFFKGIGTIITLNDEIEIERNFRPAPGFEETADIGLVSAIEVEIDGDGVGPITVFGHIYAPNDDNNEIEDGVTFFGSFVGSSLEIEGDDNKDGTLTRLFYKRPNGIIPGLSYLSNNLIVQAKKGGWLEQLN